LPPAYAGGSDRIKPPKDGTPNYSPFTIHNSPLKTSRRGFAKSAAEIKLQLRTTNKELVSMIKKAILFGTFFAAAVFIFGAAETSAQTTPAVGAYQKVSSSQAEVKAAADFAVKDQGEAFRLVKIRKAEQQVVAGMNYRMKLKVAEKKDDKETKYSVIAVVYKDLEGNYSLTSWERADK
jgi:predicted RecB family nuclease